MSHWTFTIDGPDCLVLMRGEAMGAVWPGARRIETITLVSRSKKVEHGWKAASWVPKYKSLGWCKSRAEAQQKVEAACL
jgi:hypothetical protein